MFRGMLVQEREKGFVKRTRDDGVSGARLKASMRGRVLCILHCAALSSHPKPTVRSKPNPPPHRDSKGEKLQVLVPQSSSAPQDMPSLSYSWSNPLLEGFPPSTLFPFPVTPPGGLRAWVTQVTSPRTGLVCILALCALVAWEERGGVAGRSLLRVLAFQRITTLPLSFWGHCCLEHLMLAECSPRSPPSGSSESDRPQANTFRKPWSGE